MYVTAIWNHVALVAAFLNVCWLVLRVHLSVCQLVLLVCLSCFYHESWVRVLASGSHMVKLITSWEKSEGLYISGTLVALFQKLPNFFPHKADYITERRRRRKEREAQRAAEAAAAEAAESKTRCTKLSPSPSHHPALPLSQSLPSLCLLHLLAVLCATFH